MRGSAIDIRSTRPAPDEYAEFYAGYIERVDDGDVVHQMDDQVAETLSLLVSLPEEKGAHRYAPGKWSVREVIGHVCDSERVFVYRAMRFARGDSTPLPGFDENPWVANSRFDDRELASLADELETVRLASVSFFGSLEAEAWLRRGVANDVVFTVRALAWILAGHERHHLNVLRTRYLGG